MRNKTMELRIYPASTPGVEDVVVFRSDCGCDSADQIDADYRLPRGHVVRRGFGGILRVYDRLDRYCDLVSARGGGIALHCVPTGRRIKLRELASDARA